MKPSSLVRKSVKDLDRPSYRSLPKEIIRMNDNSNLFASNPAVRKVADRFDFDSLSNYPSVFSDDLRETIGRKFGIEPSQIVVGNGSDEVIDLVMKAFIDPGDGLAIQTPTFEMYPMYVKIAGGRVIECPLREQSFQLDVDKILASKPKLIFLCSPNNPTGNCFQREDILRVIRESDALVVIDEAYCQFTGRATNMDLPNKYDNILVLRTFSKVYALAGLRIGFGIGSEEIIASLQKVCAPFRLNKFSEKVAIEALSDDDFIRRIIEMAREERDWISRELSALGAHVYPSETNFLLFRSPIPVVTLIEGLMKKGIAIRDCSNQSTLRECARVTFGRRETNEKFIEAMRSIVGENS